MESPNWFYRQRTKLKNNQAQQAKACGGIGVTSISQYERGIAMPRMTDANFSKVAAGYGISEPAMESIIIEISRGFRNGENKRPKVKKRQKKAKGG